MWPSTRIPGLPFISHTTNARETLHTTLLAFVPVSPYTALCAHSTGNTFVVAVEKPASDFELGNYTSFGGSH